MKKLQKRFPPHRALERISPTEIIEGQDRILKEFYLFLGFPEVTFQANLGRFASTLAEEHGQVLWEHEPSLNRIKIACERTWEQSSAYYLMTMGSNHRRHKGRKGWIKCAYYLLALKYTGKTVNQIGKPWGLTHSTVSQVSRRTAASLLETDRNFQEFYNQCKINLISLIKR